MLGSTKVNAKSLCMTYVKIAVRFGRKTGVNLFTLKFSALGSILFYKIPDKVALNGSFTLNILISSAICRVPPSVELCAELFKTDFKSFERLFSSENVKNFNSTARSYCFACCGNSYRPHNCAVFKLFFNRHINEAIVN